MTVKKCDACSKVYEKGYIFAYSLDSLVLLHIMKMNQ